MCGCTARHALFDGALAQPARSARALRRDPRWLTNSAIRRAAPAGRVPPAIHDRRGQTAHRHAPGLVALPVTSQQAVARAYRSPARPAFRKPQAEEEQLHDRAVAMVQRRVTRQVHQVPELVDVSVCGRCRGAFGARTPSAGFALTWPSRNRKRNQARIADRWRCRLLGKVPAVAVGA